MAEPRVTRGATRRPQSGKQSPYFLQPAKGGHVAVLRRPCGNRAEPKVCGIMPSRAYALALVKQLSRAESAVDDLFLEATDDGIEALEAVLEACRNSVLARDAAPGVNPAGAGRRGGRRRRRGRNSGQNRVDGGAGEAA